MRVGWPKPQQPGGLGYSQMPRDRADDRCVMRAFVFFAQVVFLLLAAAPSSAQVLQGAWVDESEAAIERIRKADIAVIVLDEKDRAIQGAEVRITQRRHDFVIGFEAPADRYAEPGLTDRPVYRCFNALSLERLTDWAVDTNDSVLPSAKVMASWREAIDPIQTRFGRVVSADPARNADALGLLEGSDLRDVLLARCDYAMSMTPRVDTYDLYAELLDQDMIERKLGPGAVHQLFERARAHRPDAELNLRVRDAVSLGRGREVVQLAQRMEARQIHFDGVTIEQRFRGQVNPLSLRRILADSIGRLDRPVTLAGLEIGGSSAVAASLNAETVLRLVFAQEGVEGFVFAGLTQDDLIEPHAALIDAEGEPTPSGLVIDRLLRERWWSNLEITTDERGNAQARVFTGWHDVSAKLPDGTVLSGRAYVPRSDRRKLIVLQVTKADRSSEPND